MEIHIGDRVADVTLVSKEGNKVQLTIDGKPYEVDIVMAENGSCSILHDGNSFNAGLVRGEGGKSYDVSISGFKSLRQVCGKPWRMLSFPQSMIIMQVCIMESGRDILAAMFLLEREVGKKI